MEERLLTLVEDIVENRSQHVRMIGLLFPLPVAVVEACHNSPSTWFSFQEASLEVFHQGAFPAARLSLEKEKVRAISGRPGKIFLMVPEPLQGAFVLF